MGTQASTSIPSHFAHRLFFMVCVFLFLFIILFGGISALFMQTYAYSEKIFYGITVGSINASGLTKQELAQRLYSASETIKRQGIQARYEDSSHVKKLARIPLEHTFLQSDIPIQALGDMFTLDTEKTVEQAYALGRVGTFFQKYRDRISFLFLGKQLSANVFLNSELFTQSLKKELISSEFPPRNAAFVFIEKDKKISIDPEHTGNEIDTEKAFKDTMAFLRMIERPSLTLTFDTRRASLSADDLLNFRTDAQQLIENAPLMLSLDKKTWQISAHLLTSWLTITEDSSQNPILSLDTALIISYLEDTIAPQIHREPQIARFEMKDGKVTAFEQEKNGKDLDNEKSALAIVSAVSEKNQKTVSLITKETAPPLLTDESQPLVHDLLASAETDFRGSPKNRIFNISLGANRIHGVLIEPGKEFSLISFLGKIDEKSGFLPELVIKGSKTMPEFGGGLCQVSTTLFRTVAAAGLPVLERKNHSYRVPYYEPPIGFDATIYYPKPDFRFLNDTAYPILIQTRVRGTKIKMTLWGTKDARITEIDTPIVSNRREAGEVKMIETDSLKPGEKKCIERAHGGADAIFERRVTYPDGGVKKDIFKSHYVVWPAVCLVGKQPEDTNISKTSTSTPSIQESPPIQNGLPPSENNFSPTSVDTQKKTPE